MQAVGTNVDVIHTRRKGKRWEPIRRPGYERHYGTFLPGELDWETIAFREFLPSADSVSLVRHYVTQTLEGQGVHAELVTACQLVADELATNALRHAGSFFSVALAMSGARVRIAVRDDSHAFPVPRKIRLLSMSGRGLTVVGGIARDWGAESLGHGKETWAELS